MPSRSDFLASFKNSLLNAAPSKLRSSANINTRLIKNRKPDGSIRIHDAKLYRCRDNHGRNGNHYTRAQLEKIFREAREDGPTPILHTHNYRKGPIGYLTGHWFGNDGWLHCSFKIYSKAQMKNDLRYETIVDNFKRGILNMVSLSVRQRKLGNGKWDPNDLKLNEISVCRKGDHKNCDIGVIEASDSNKANVYKTGGEIMALNLDIETGPSKLGDKPISVDELVQFAKENGVEFSEEELKGLSVSENPLVVAAALVVQKTIANKHMTDAQRKQLEEDAEMGRRLRAEKEAAYKAKQEASVKEMSEFVEAEFKAERLNEKEYNDAKHIIEKVASNPDAEVMMKLLMGPLTKAKTAAAAQQQAEKASAELTSQLRAAERRERQTLTHRAATSPSAAATTAAAPPAEKRSAPADDAPPAKRNKADTKPENLAQKLAPKMDGQYVVIEADATAGHKPWIDHLYADALQGSRAQSIESNIMNTLQEILSEPDFKRNASNTIIPMPGKQGFSQQQVQYHWGKGIF